MYMPDPLATSSVASAGMGALTLQTGADVLSVGVLFFATLATVTAGWSIVHRIRHRKAVALHPMGDRAVGGLTRREARGVMRTP